MINIITSNIRFDNPQDGKDTWNNRKTFLAQTLLKRTPSIIGTQEGRETQLRDFHNLLENMNLIDSHRNWITERMYPCLFIDKDIDILTSGDFWLSETPDVPGSKSFNSMFPRLCTWAKVSEEQNTFFVFNVHLDHSEDLVREKQADVVISQISKINSEKLPIILMGDFNSSPSSKVYNKLTNELQLIDPWATENKLEETSFHQFKGSFDKGTRIDWILYSNEFSHTSAELIKDHMNGDYPSDHFPFFSTLEFR